MSYTKRPKLHLVMPADINQNLTPRVTPSIDTKAGTAYRDLERYYAAVDRALLDLEAQLTIPEIKLILATVGAYEWANPDEPWELDNLIANYAEDYTSVEYNNPDHAEYAAIAPALAAKLKAAGTFACLALVDSGERYFNARMKGKPPAITALVRPNY